MGYLYQNHCYETKQEYLNSLALECFGPNGGTGGLGTYFTICTPNSDDITVQAYQLFNGTPQTPWTVTPLLISCTYEPPGSQTTADIIEVSWLVVAALATAYAMKVLIDIVKRY